MAMTWLSTLITVLVGYFFLLARSVWCLCRSKARTGKTTLVLTVKGGADFLEALMWDVFRLQSWENYHFDLLVIDSSPGAETSLILKSLRRKHYFSLIKFPSGAPFRLGYYQTEYQKVKTYEITGREPLQAARRKIITLLHDRQEDDYYARSS